ncbi:MAG TPA: hypothetical protein VHO69_13265 [Phototrophicaceae bacterium]|nr:hypothetical protein [Phototrophicaceae bacterium]
MKRIWFGLVGLVLAGCASTPTPPPPVTSAWGTIITVGQAEQTGAPNLLAENKQVSLAWIGADETGVHQDSRTITTTGLSARVVLPLPPTRPYAQQIAPASGGRFHLLWLDADAEAQSQLYTATITSALETERGPVQLSSQPTRRYTLLPADNGTLEIITSGGQPAEPALFYHFVDASGRPRQETNNALVTDADWPTLAHTSDNTAYLFWRQPNDGQVLRGQLVNGRVDTPEPVTQIRLKAGDRLDSLNAALDNTTQYLFWNLTRANGDHESWYTCRSLNENSWSPADRLGVQPQPDQSFETGFNSGAAKVARNGEHWLSWAAPLTGQFEMLPVAARVGNTLALIYFQGGQLIGYQAIVTPVEILGQPVLQADRDKFLYLAWAQPNANGSADLYLTTLKAALWAWAPPTP